jgi:hypothetical protein
MTGFHCGNPAIGEFLNVKLPAHRAGLGCAPALNPGVEKEREAIVSDAVALDRVILITS